MTNQDLIINGVDHAKFDLEWAKRGGVLMYGAAESNLLKLLKMIECDGEFPWCIPMSRKPNGGLEKSRQLALIIDPYHLRMATPAECEDAGIEYIEPPTRWLPIESAPIDGRIIEVADFREIVANDEYPISKHWKYWRDIPHPLNKNSMTQPPKDE